MKKINNYGDELDYLIDKVENPDNDKTWSDMVDDLNYNVHPDVLRKSFTGGRYGGYAVAKYFLNRIEEGYSKDELERLETLRNEIYKERCRLSDLKREKRKGLRDEARFDALIDVLKSAMDSYEPISIAPFVFRTGDEKVTGVLQLSDWHALKTIDNQWNYYDRDVCIQRANTITDKTIEKSLLHGITDLIVEINGDMVDGVIQVSARSAEEADVITQVVFVSNLLSQIIAKLCKHFETVTVITTLGNHGRLFADKKQGVTKENFEMFIPEFLKLYLEKAGANNFKIVKSYGLDFVGYEVNEKFIMVSHGQNDSLSEVVSDFSKMFKRVPNEVHLGHTHSYKDINDNDVFVTVNGCLCGADDYAISKRKITKPAQNLIIYDGDDRCIYSLVAE